MYSLKDYYDEAGVLEQPEWAAQIPILHPFTGEEMKPRWAQITGLELAFNQPNQRVGIFDDMGAGKSLISHAFAIWHAWAGNGVVATMPPILMPQWQRNLFRTFRGVGKHISAEIYQGTPKQRDKLVARWYADKKPDIVLSSYDMFRDEGAVLFGAMLQYGVLVADECRVMGNPDNKTYAAVEQFMGPNGEKAAMLMNGTPARTTLVDLFGYINFLTPGTYGNRKHFDKEHVRYKKISVQYRRKSGKIAKREQQIIDTFRNTEQLFRNLYKQARRIEKREALEMGTCDVIVRDVLLTGEHQRRYRQMVEERLLMFDDDSMIDLTNSAAVRHVCMRAIIDPSEMQVKGDSNVVLGADQILDELDLTKTKVFICAHYRTTVELLAARYAKYKPAIVYGGNKNDQEKDRFINDPNCRLMIANYVSGGVGLDGLQNVCHTGIAVEPTTIPGDFAQAVGRLDRPGQVEPVTFYVMNVPGTVYRKSITDMTNRSDAIAGVVSRDKPMSKMELRYELLGVETDDSEDGIDF